MNPVENLRADPRANKLAISVFNTNDDIGGACRNAWNVLAIDPKAMDSMTSCA